MNKRQKLQDQFVNLYRQVWGTNAGLDLGSNEGRINNMSNRELEQSIWGFQQMLNKF